MRTVKISTDYHFYKVELDKCRAEVESLKQNIERIITDKDNCAIEWGKCLEENRQLKADNAHAWDRVSRGDKRCQTFEDDLARLTEENKRLKDELRGYVTVDSATEATGG